MLTVTKLGSGIVSLLLGVICGAVFAQGISADIDRADSTGGEGNFWALAVGPFAVLALVLTVLGVTLIVMAAVSRRPQSPVTIS